MKSHRRTTNCPRWTPRVMVAAITCLAGGNSAADYPPPPGAYQSDPASFSVPPPSPQAAPAKAEPRPSGPSSRMLPLPDSGVQREPGAYDAARLFGSRNTPPVHESAEKTRDRGRTPEVFAPTTYPKSPQMPQEGFSMNFERGDTGHPPADPYRPQTAPLRKDYPAHAQRYPQSAPGYPDYPQYPGQTMGSAPAGPRYPAYPETYPEGYRGMYRGQPVPIQPQATVSGGGLRDTGARPGYAPASDTATPGRASQGSHAGNYPQGSHSAANDPPRQAFMPAPEAPTGSAYQGIKTTAGAPTPAPGNDAIFRPPSL